jgi:putative nucleotidyltransferase with HDIG domain
VGSLTLFLLPGVERLFDVATGLTLIELRDPQHPLLRELQLRAPGTYTHSLNVATIAEAAADAIHADTLLTYVGALYHDIGKMNKPEYFVENQVGGVNRHEKLSPAMSLLVIVGHVKDGMELAREFRLPRPVRHFIESHHGTTLVEFFYHRARQQALAEKGRAPEDEGQVPDEFEYRYPGPKPRTREAAILMIADAVESTTRTLEDPTPARIDSVVRSIVMKRLLDGQFDDCGITLVELNRISEAVGRTVASLYHSRIQYPEDQGGAEARRA